MENERKSSDYGSAKLKVISGDSNNELAALVKHLFCSVLSSIVSAIS